MFTFSVGSQSMNTMLITPAAQNTDATAFQLTGILYNLWLSMKMDVSNALKLILSKIVNPCLTMSPWIQGAYLFLLSMTEEVQEHLQTSIFVNFHHTSCYPPCSHTLLYPVVHGQCWVQFLQIIPVQWVNLELCLVGFPKPVPPLAPRSHFLDLLG